MMKKQYSAVSLKTDRLYKDFKEEVGSYDPKKDSPPAIINFFTPMRQRYFRKLDSILRGVDDSTRSQKILEFIEIVDYDILANFKKTIKDDYTLRVLDRDYNIPTNIDTREAKKHHINEELSQLAEHIAEWSIELEMMLDLINSIEMYEMTKLKHTKESYIKAFKADFAPRNILTLGNAIDFLLKKVVGMMLKRVTHLALIKGINRMQFTAPVIMEIVYSVAYLKVIPWSMMLEFINMPWIAGSTVLYFALCKVGEVADKNDTRLRINHCSETIVSNKLYMTEARTKLLDLLKNCLDYKEHDTKQANVLKLQMELDYLLIPTKVQRDIDHKTLKPQNEDAIIETLLEFKEIDDYIVVENVSFKEEENEDGFIVVCKS